METMHCKKHPYSQLVGGACAYCQLTHLLRHCGKRRLPRPAHLLLWHRFDDAQAVAFEDERQRLLAIEVEERLKC